MGEAIRIIGIDPGLRRTGWGELPKDFLDLVTRSLRLQALVRRMDEEIYGGAYADTPAAARRANPVSDQITLLNTAFARG